jgi:chloramphenicol O-acetyltransferase type A
MYRKLEIDSWNRKSQFEFFRNYDNPFFNICSEVNVQKLYEFTERNNLSFFITSLYLSLKAANEIEEFRYRILDGEVVVYDYVNAGSTVLNNDDTFSFCYFDYLPDLQKFHDAASKLIKECTTQGSDLDPRKKELNMIHYSIIPWVSFTSISHPRKFNTDDTIPKIVFGKYYKKNGSLMMPISVEVHHSLMDGLHVGRYLGLLQSLYNNPAGNGADNIIV